MKRLALLMTIVALPANADPAACAKITADLDRLACYDAATGVTPKATVVESASKWTVRVEKSDFEDTTDVYLSLQSDEPLTCGRFSSPQRAQLLLRCMENTTVVYIGTNCHLTSGHGGYGNVDVRIDDEKAFTVSMQDSTDNRALGLWSGGRSIPFIKRLIGKDRMIVRFTPFSESPTTASFSISGLAEDITPLRSACKW